MVFEKFDRKDLVVRPLAERRHKMTVADIKPLSARAVYASAYLDALAERIVEARRNGRPVICMMGAHPLRRGNSLFFIDLMRRGLITHIATNGAVVIHDFELAFQGGTLEDVEFYIRDGKFGHWEETGLFINQAIVRGRCHGIGFGEAIGRMIERENYPTMQHKDISIFAEAYRRGIPITVHKSIGHDITDQHPSADFAALGEASGTDFLIFAEAISRLEGGVFLNLGSAVTGPEVYLKALSMARNRAAQKNEEIRHFTTAVFDIVPLGDWKREEGIVDYRRPEALQDPRYYFRPLKSILVRTVKDGGEGFYIEGDFAQTIPVLYHRVLDAQKKAAS